MADGYWTVEQRIKEDAEPIDNETKFAWDDDDYEEVEVFHEYTEDELAKIAEAEQRQESQELADSLPDAVAELSEMVSDNEVDMADIMDAIAELSEIVSSLMEGE